MVLKLDFNFLEILYLDDILENLIHPMPLALPYFWVTKPTRRPLKGSLGPLGNILIT